LGHPEFVGTVFRRPSQKADPAQHSHQDGYANRLARIVADPCTDFAEKRGETGLDRVTKLFGARLFGCCRRSVVAGHDDAICQLSQIADSVLDFMTTFWITMDPFVGGSMKKLKEMNDKDQRGCSGPDRETNKKRIKR
jgi:hypothetical protein